MRLEWDTATKTLTILLPPEGTPGPRVEVIYSTAIAPGVGPEPFLPMPQHVADPEVFALLPVYLAGEPPRDDEPHVAVA